MSIVSNVVFRIYVLTMERLHPFVPKIRIYFLYHTIFWIPPHRKKESLLYKRFHLFYLCILGLRCICSCTSFSIRDMLGILSLTFSSIRFPILYSSVTSSTEELIARWSILRSLSFSLSSDEKRVFKVLEGLFSWGYNLRVFLCQTLTKDPQQVWQTLKNFDYPTIPPLSFYPFFFYTFYIWFSAFISFS